jgi:hypothetical protein
MRRAGNTLGVLLFGEACRRVELTRKTPWLATSVAGTDDGMDDV